MSELLLPIGSVVQLREAEKPVMIFGVYQQRVTDGRNFDYIGEAYPEGFLGGQSNLLFDAEDIAEVLFTGYQTPEYESLMTRAAAHFAPMSVINALIVSVGLQQEDSVAKTYEDLERIWDEYDAFERVE